MDSTNSNGIGIEEAVCLTFGYDQEILITKKIDEEFLNSKITKLAKKFSYIANGKEVKLTDFEEDLKSCLPDNVLKEGEFKIFEAIKNLKSQLEESDRTYKSVIAKQPSDKKMPFGHFLAKHISYSSLKYNKSVSGGQSILVFGKEYSLLNLNKREAIIGLREITTDSICRDSTKMTQLNHLKTLSDADIIGYAKKFMAKHKFSINERLIEYAWKRLKTLSADTNKKSSFSTDDIDNQNDIIKRLKKFSISDLSKVNVKKIDQCKSICIQNMALSGESITELSDSEADIFKQLCYMYTGDLNKFMNGYLRNKLVPVYEWEEDLIKKYSEIRKGLVFYSKTDFSDRVILPYDVYNQIKESSHLLVEHLKNHSLKPGSKCWRLMDVAGLNSMLNKKIIECRDNQIKDELKESGVRTKLYAQYNKQLSGKLLSANSFLSTSLDSNGVLYTDGIDKKSIVMNITAKGNSQGICMDNYTPEKYKGVSEFLFNKGSKLRIESVSRYTGKTNVSLLKDKCLQLNCSCC